MSVDHQKDLFSYLNGTSGASDGSSYGELGLSKYQADQSRALQKSNNFSSTIPASSDSIFSSSKGSLFSTDSSSTGYHSTGTASYSGYSSGSSAKSSFDEFYELSDWLFQPIEEIVPQWVVNILLVCATILGAMWFSVSADDLNVISVLLGGVLGFVLPPIAYFALRTAVSLAFVVLIVGLFGLGVFIVISVILTILN